MKMRVSVGSRWIHVSIVVQDGIVLERGTFMSYADYIWRARHQQGSATFVSNVTVRDSDSDTADAADLDAAVVAIWETDISRFKKVITALCPAHVAFA
jgi:hypothetical protein